MNAYVLDFKGRCNKTSVKNFQLTDEDDKIIYLQCGKTSENDFNMDLQYPFSPLQAFGICLASFDNKFAVE